MFNALSRHYGAEIAAVIAIIVVVLKIIAHKQARTRARKEEEERLLKVKAGDLEHQTELEFVQSVDETLGKQFKRHNEIVPKLYGVTVFFSLVFSVLYMANVKAVTQSGLIITSIIFPVVGCGLVFFIYNAKAKEILAQAKAMKNGGEELAKPSEPPTSDNTPLSSSPSLTSEPNAPSSDASASQQTNEIREYAALHADGIISDEEFAAKKKQLLGL